MKMSRLCEHSCARMAACTIMTPKNTFINGTHVVVESRYSIAYHALVLAATIW